MGNHLLTLEEKIDKLTYMIQIDSETRDIVALMDDIIMSHEVDGSELIAFVDKITKIVNREHDAGVRNEKIIWTETRIFLDDVVEV